MNRIYQFLWTSGICAVSGAIAGAFIGAVFGLVTFVAANPVMPRPVLLGVAIGLSLAAWLLVLVIVGVFGNYGPLAIAGQSLVTCAITGVLTVFLVYATRVGLAGMLLGWIIGFLVGKTLCRACYGSQRRAV